MSGISANKRQFPRPKRMPLRCPVEVGVGPRKLTAQLFDISLGGMQLGFEPTAAESLNEGDELSVSCSLPHGIGEIQLVARVVWLNREATDYRGQTVVAAGVRLVNVEASLEAALTRMLAERPTLVLLIGLQPDQLWFAPGTYAEQLEPQCCGSPAQVLQVLEQQQVGVLVVGPELASEQARDLLISAARDLPHNPTVNVVFSSGDDPAPLQPLLDAEQLFYFSPEPASAGEMGSIVRAAARQYWTRVTGSEHWGLLQPEVDERLMQRILELARRVAAQPDLGKAVRMVAAALTPLVAASRGYCFVYDAETDTLRIPAESDDELQRIKASVGLSSYVIRTGQTVRLARANADPRFDQAVDDPAGKDTAQLLCLPLTSPGGEVIAVVVAIREASGPEFSAGDAETLGLFASQTAPILDRFGWHEQADEQRAAVNEALRDQAQDLFRTEAVDYHRRQNAAQGNPLTIGSGWQRWSFRLLVAMIVAALLYVTLGQVHEYAEGPAVVRVTGRTDLTALFTGTVTEVVAQPGQRVAAGQLLVRFHDTEQTAELARIDSQFELQLINRLRDPDDESARQALIQLRSQRKLAQVRLGERQVRAPHDGLVTDVRVRSGRHVDAGEMLATLVRDKASYYVVAILPGQYRPQLAPGMALRLELGGYERVYRKLAVASIGDEVVGPQEAKRFLGPEIADALSPTGPVVLLQATLPSATFAVAGRHYGYYDGMTGTARIRLRSESILITLVPGLKALLQRADSS